MADDKICIPGARYRQCHRGKKKSGQTRNRVRHRVIHRVPDIEWATGQTRSNSALTAVNASGVSTSVSAALPLKGTSATASG